MQLRNMSIAFRANSLGVTEGTLVRLSFQLQTRMQPFSRAPQQTMQHKA